MGDVLTFIGGRSLVELCLFALMIVFLVSMLLVAVYLFISFLLRRMKQEGVDKASIGIASVDFEDKNGGGNDHA
jgi:Flp pilus assembly protein TadG